MSSQGQSRAAWYAVLAAALLLLAGGAGHRWLEQELFAAGGAPVTLRRPLATLPLQVDEWRGIDVPINDRLVEISGTDDHVNRQYVHLGTQQTVNLYVGYAARPARMLGHRPQVCYPAHGWTHMASEPIQLTLADGSTRECLAHHFTRDWAVPRHLVVLSYFLLEGEPARDWTQSWRPRWRLPNLGRNPNFYVAQVQVSTTVDDSAGPGDPLAPAVRFAGRIAPYVESLLPRQAGQLQQGPG